MNIFTIYLKDNDGRMKKNTWMQVTEDQCSIQLRF